MKKLSIGSWAYIFNQEKPTNDFHEILHKLQHLGYDGVELGSFGVHPTPLSHPTKASRQALKKMVADHGLEFSGIAVDLWGFKKPGPSILDENPTPYVAAFLGFTVFAADLGIATIRDRVAQASLRAACSWSGGSRWFSGQAGVGDSHGYPA